MIICWAFYGPHLVARYRTCEDWRNPEMAKAQAKQSPNAEDAAKLLTEDHRKVQKIFEEFKKLGDDDTEEKEDLVRNWLHGIENPCWM